MSRVKVSPHSTMFQRENQFVRSFIFMFHTFWMKIAASVSIRLLIRECHELSEGRSS